MEENPDNENTNQDNGNWDAICGTNTFIIVVRNTHKQINAQMERDTLRK